MRLSTSQIFSSNLAGYQKDYADLAKTQLQISSGNRIQTPSDDPAGSAQLVRLGQQQAQLTQYSSNMTTATNSLTQEESVLDSVNSNLQRARTLAISAGDGSLSDDDRSAIADELDQIQQQLVSLMNTKDANGNYLFSGSKGNVQPFVQNNADGSYSYQGDQNTLSLQVADSLYISSNDNGWSVFGAASNASQTQTSLTVNPGTDGAQRVYLSQGVITDDSTYSSEFTGDSNAPYTVKIISATEYQIKDQAGNDVTSEATGTYDATDSSAATISFRGMQFSITTDLQDGDDSSAVAGYEFKLEKASDAQTQNILNTIGQLRDALNTPVTDTQSQVDLQDTIASSLSNLTNGMDQVSQTISSIGSRINSLDTLTEENQSLALANTNTQSSIRDTDLAEAASTLTLQQTVLEAAQASFVKIAQLSLFDKL